MIEKKIITAISKVVKKGSKNLHEPIFFGREKHYLNDCIKTGYVSYIGKYVNIFEDKIKKYTKSKYAIALVNGTSAIHILLNSMNVTEEDEVLLPSLTFVATANAVKYCGATPNFVDIETENLGVCPEKLKKYLKRVLIKKGKNYINKLSKKKIKTIIVVHLFGIPCQIEKIKKVCKKYNIKVIEDAAEAMGSFYKNAHLGNFSEAGVISFNGNKTITCGGGAVVITSKKKIADKIKHLSTTAKIKHRWEYIHDQMGYNYRMTNLNAAVGCAQLENIHNILKAKRKNFTDYYKAFEGIKEIELLKEPIKSKSNYWLITLNLKKNYKLKNSILRKLNNLGINARAIWKPLHTLIYLKDHPKDNLQNTIKVYRRMINLPSSANINFK
jgi:perosamine synthetase